jgi:uncharacterized protein (DUF488 family)
LSVHTLGHSTWAWEDFKTILGDKILLDTRSHPGSRWPQFQQEFMQEHLGDQYEWWPELGGWTSRHAELADRFPQVDIAAYSQRKFPKQRIALNTTPEEGKPTWTNIGLLDYSWYTTLDEFQEGVDRLIERGQQQDVAIVCCEAQWYRCHRSLISDCLWFRGVDSYHINAWNTKTWGVRSSNKPHSLVISNRLERYPEPVIESWKEHVGALSGK